MPPTVKSLRIQNPEARLGLREFVCASLVLEFEYARTSKERAELALHLNRASMECEVLRVATGVLKRERA